MIELEKEIVNYCDAIRHMNNSTAHGILKVDHQHILNLMGRSPQPHVLHGTVISAQQLHEMRQATGDRIAMINLHTIILILCYLFHQYREARDNAKQAKNYAENQAGNYIGVLLNFYDSLTCLGWYGEAPAAECRQTLRIVRKNQEKMHQWARHAPANFLHKWYLVEAELARVRGNAALAGDCYEQAVRLAQNGKFLREEALAQELAGQFHLARGQQLLARLYLRESVQSYRRWGAMAKVHDLENRYPWLTEWKEALLSRASANTYSSISTSTSSDMLDWVTVTKASQALSQKIRLDQLLKRFMEAALEHAGAQSGMLLLKIEGGWHIEAQQSQHQQQAAVLQAIVLDESRLDSLPLPLSLLRYVERTGESMVIHEAASNELTAGDSYVQRRSPRSLLMVPVLHQGASMGMLYLENNAASGAFTEARLQVLEVLAAQTAISIENARRYTDMEQKIAEHAAELRAPSPHSKMADMTSR